MYHQKELNDALSSIFTDIDSLGFWDNLHNRINSKLQHNIDWEWTAINDNNDRYGVFALSCILLAKYLYSLDTQKYDHKINSYLRYIRHHISDYSLQDLTYGAFNTLVLGAVIYKDKSYDQQIEQCIIRFKKHIPTITDNNYSLLLIGLSYYLKHLSPNDHSSKKYLQNLVKRLLASQNQDGYFQTGDLRLFHHQRVMYTLWGLIIASEHYLPQKIKAVVEKPLGYIWQHCKDSNDNAFLWHPRFYFAKTSFGLPIPIYIQKSPAYLFECHQSFFTNAVKLYKTVYNSNRFDEYSKKAMDWIFGQNRIKTNLVEVTKINIPARIMTLDGNLFVKGQNFKGSYEIGSYILALC